MPRFTIDLDEKFAKILDQLASDKGTTKAETVRNAVLSYSYLQREICKGENSKISITDAKDRVIKDVLLP